MIQITLPWPPSVNRIWRNAGGKTYRDPKYMAWIKETGWVIKLAKCTKIIGPFSASIVLYPPDKRKIDIDNRIKVILDAAQKNDLIEDDSMCRLLLVSYGYDTATPSALLTLKPMG
jgi:crossover junction endodeoxyribonuclease RusA